MGGGISFTKRSPEMENQIEIGKSISTTKIKKYKYEINRNNQSLIFEINSISERCMSSLKEIHEHLRVNNLHTFLHKRLCFDSESLSGEEIPSSSDIMRAIEILMKTADELKPKTSFFLSTIGLNSAANGLILMLHGAVSSLHTEKAKIEFSKFHDSFFNNPSDSMKIITKSAVLKKSRTVSVSWLCLDAVTLELGFRALPELNERSKLVRAGAGIIFGAVKSFMTMTLDTNFVNSFVDAAKVSSNPILYKAVTNKAVSFSLYLFNNLFF